METVAAAAATDRSVLPLVTVPAYVSGAAQTRHVSLTICRMCDFSFSAATSTKENWSLFTPFPVQEDIFFRVRANIRVLLVRSMCMFHMHRSTFTLVRDLTGGLSD